MGEAEALVRQLIDEEPDDPRAWDRLTRIHKDGQDWEALVASATRFAEVAELADELFERNYALKLRARALAELVTE